MKSKYNFQINYWGNDKSTKAQFSPLQEIPKNTHISACMVIVIDDNNRLLLAKPNRGWGLPGGHLEKDETPEECCKREVIEETSVSVKNLKLVGAWKAEHVFKSEYNKNYVSPAYQLLYIADVEQIHEYIPKHEVSVRKFVKLSDLEKYHHNYESFSEILRYVKENHYAH